MKRKLLLATPQMEGPDVRYAQNLLQKEAGHGPFYRGPTDNDFGILMSQATYRAQWWNGWAKPTHVFWTPLEEILLNPRKRTPAMEQRIKLREKALQQKPLREKALEHAKTFVGYYEDCGTNCVTQITRWYGYNAQWCCMTMCKAYVLAGSKTWKRGGFSAYVPTVVGSARMGLYGLTVTTNPQPGDLVCFDWDRSNFAAGNNHIGMFVQWVNRSAGTFKTIEGNWSNRCGYVDRDKDSYHVVFVHCSK